MNWTFFKVPLESVSQISINTLQNTEILLRECKVDDYSHFFVYFLKVGLDDPISESNYSLSPFFRQQLDM